MVCNTKAQIMRIGVDIDGTRMRLGVVDGGQIFRQIEAPTQASKSQNEVTKQLKELIHSIFNSNVRGIGIGVSAVVKPSKGIIKNASNIPSWKEVPLKKILEKEFNVPVYINNDSNCFAFGERYYGEGTIYKDIVCITLGIGVGAGVIINNVLYSGNNSGAGEIGSVPYLDADYESYCGQKFFTRNNTTAEKAYELALRGDVKMLALWNELGSHIGNLINTILYTYDPQAIILGGDIINGFEFFVRDMFKNITGFPYKDTIDGVKILLSKKHNINLLGAAALVV